MKPRFSKTLLVIVLYLLVPLFLFFWLNLQVSQKYEVEHARIFVEINSKLTKEQKAAQFEELADLENEIKSSSLLMIILASGSFASASFLAYKFSK